MITTPTTFVVGAGASVPYGLPVGSRLLALAKGSRQDTTTPVYEYLRRIHDADSVDRVLADLERFDGPSIDEFMLTRSTDATTQVVCRGMIAGLIGNTIAQAEAHNTTAPPEQDWIAAAASQMLSGAATFDELITRTKLTFVTFNFDSIVERELIRRVRGRFPGGTVDERRLLEAVKVTHIHGQLPSPPRPLKPITPPFYNINEGWKNWIPEAAKCVTVISDEVDDSALEGARASIAAANVLCFLGFSLHPTNIKRLGLPLKASQPRVFVSTFNEPRGRLDQYRARIGGFSNIEFGDRTHSCCHVLQELPVFVD